MVLAGSVPWLGQEVQVGEGNVGLGRKCSMVGPRSAGIRTGSVGVGSRCEYEHRLVLAGSFSRKCWLAQEVAGC